MSRQKKRLNNNNSCTERLRNLYIERHREKTSRLLLHQTDSEVYTKVIIRDYVPLVLHVQYKVVYVLVDQKVRNSKVFSEKKV